MHSFSRQTCGAMLAGPVRKGNIPVMCINALISGIYLGNTNKNSQICVEKNQTLQSLLSGTDMVNIVLEMAKYGHRYRALNILQQTIEDAHNGKRQFLSGKMSVL